MNCKNNQNVSKILDQLLTKIAEDNFAGWDPYDGLNSYFVHFPVLKRSKWYKIAVTQFFRRCPFNFRSFAGIERAVNPKSLGLVLLADSALAGELLDDAHRDKVFRLLEKKAIMGKEYQRLNNLALEKFFEFFSCENNKKIKQTLDKGKYYPQEYLNKDELIDIWRKLN